VAVRFLHHVSVLLASADGVLVDV
jgi:hypothetical protein